MNTTAIAKQHTGTTAQRDFFRLLIGMTAAVILLLSFPASAQLIFSDTFESGGSPFWQNQRGNWVATNGVYTALMPNNAPPTYSSLPFILTNFTVDVDVLDVGDGGIWLRTDAGGSNGVLLVIGGHGWGYPNHGGDPEAGRTLYWHTVSGGNYSPHLNEAHNVFTNPGTQDTHIRVQVRGNVYSAFVDGVAVTALTNSQFTSGRVGLYDFSSQTFDNFVLTGLQPVPSVRASEVEITWNSSSNEQYVVEFRSALSNTGWETLTNVVGTGSTMVVHDPIEAGRTQRFYRVTVVEN